MSDDPHRVFHLLVADSLEALLPLIDSWAETVEGRPHRHEPRGFDEGYRAGVAAMAAEVKDQLVERILRLRSSEGEVEG